MMTEQQVAELFGVSIRQVRWWHDSGRLQGERPAGSLARLITVDSARGLLLDQLQAVFDAAGKVQEQVDNIAPHRDAALYELKAAVNTFRSQSGKKTT